MCIEVRKSERECSGLAEGTIEVGDAVDEILGRQKADLIYLIPKIDIHPALI